MKTPAIKQFKLTNDEEIVCEVLEWDNDENTAILVRAALRIIQGEDMDRGFRFYAFRPWMGFSEDPETLHTLNAAHVIGETNPSDDLLKQYAETILKLKRLATVKKKDIDMDIFNDMDDDEIEEYISYHLLSDSDETKEEGNVIKFPDGKFTRH